MRTSVRFPLTTIFSILVVFLAACTLGGSTASPAPGLDGTDGGAPGTGDAGVGTGAAADVRGEPASPANTDGAATISVPGASFAVGAAERDMLAGPDEKPQHIVNISGYHIYAREVTNAEYQACVAAGGCAPANLLPADMLGYDTLADYQDFPVVSVDWSMADDYCRWAGGRLPTEAEWEIASRGKGDNIFPWGDSMPTCEQASYADCQGGLALPYAVGYFPAGNSPWGAQDMAGNAWEWVNDWYAAGGYSAETVTDPSGPWNGTLKIVRGGGWASGFANLRTSLRAGVRPEDSYGDLGFRCVANPAPAPMAVAAASGAHSVSESGSTTLEGGTPPGRRFTWRFVSAGCTRHPTFPENVLGVTLEILETPTMYVHASVNGSPLTGGAAPGLTTRYGALPSVAEGTPLTLRIWVTNADGSPIPWAESSTTFAMPAPCPTAGGAPEPFTHQMVCYAGGYSMTVSVRPLMLVFDSLTVNAIPITPPGGPISGIRFQLSATDAPAGAPVSVHVRAHSPDDVTGYTWTETVTAPLCPEVLPTFTVTPSCSATAGYDLEIRVDQISTPVIGFAISDGRIILCSQTVPGQYRCNHVPEEAFGPGGTGSTIRALLFPGTTYGGVPLDSVGITLPARPSCPAPAPTGSGDWSLSVACNIEVRDGSVIATIGIPAELHTDGHVPFSIASVMDSGGSGGFIRPFYTTNAGAGVLYHFALYDIPPGASGFLRICVDPGDTGSSDNLVCHDFMDFESLRTAARCSAGTPEEWSMNVSCSSDPGFYTTTASYPAGLQASACTFLASYGGLTGGILTVLDSAAHTCTSPRSSADFLNRANLRLGVMQVDGTYVEHGFGIGTLPSCGSEAAVGWNLYVACGSAADTVDLYMTYPSSLPDVQSCWMLQTFSGVPNPIGGMLDVLNHRCVLYGSEYGLVYDTSLGLVVNGLNGARSTRDFGSANPYMPSWAACNPDAGGPADPPSNPPPGGGPTDTPSAPGCSTWGDAASCKAAIGCSWWIGKGVCADIPDPCTGPTDKDSCMNPGGSPSGCDWLDGSSICVTP